MDNYDKLRGYIIENSSIKDSDIRINEMQHGATKTTLF